MSKEDKDKVDDALVKALTKKHNMNSGSVIDTIKRKDKKSKSDTDKDTILKNLDDMIDERNEDIVDELTSDISDEDFIEIFNSSVTPKEKKVKEIEESNQTEFKELIESFSEARFESGDNTIRNVCVLTSISKNNRVYKETAMANVLELINGTKCYTDHSFEKGKIRSVRDLIGEFKNPHIVNNKIYADLQVLSNKIDFIMPIAKEMPHQVGLSIVAQGKMHPERDEKGRAQVESIVSLRSCDIVTDPATVNSLFETLGVKKDGTIGGVRVGNKFNPKSPVCEYTHKVTCPVYSELNTDYTKCLLFKDGNNCPYAEGGEFFRGKKTSEEISDSEFVDRITE